ncbi:3531_t:CDS:2, partial [Diversispora eburnea]
MSAITSTINVRGELSAHNDIPYTNNNLRISQEIRDIAQKLIKNRKVGKRQSDANIVDFSSKKP